MAAIHRTDDSTDVTDDQIDAYHRHKRVECDCIERIATQIETELDVYAARQTATADGPGLRVNIATDNTATPGDVHEFLDGSGFDLETQLSGEGSHWLIYRREIPFPGGL